MRASEFITEEVIKLGSKANTDARKWVEKITSMFPENPLNPDANYMQIDNAIVQFELQPLWDNVVELKWIQAVPMRSGAGSKALNKLQELAKQDNIILELTPWGNKQSSEKDLRKFYTKHGFKKSDDDRMTWSPR